MACKPGKFQFAIDRGGTFTDVFARCPGGNTRVLKLLSEDPQNYKDAPTEGIRRVLQEVKKQVEVLGTFLPDEILKLRHDELQDTQTFVGVLLFADVSGFTQLTEKYNKTGKGGIYRLTATLNAYIGAIVEVLYFYGGDVLKFSGDAFLALWKVMPDESLFEILHGVVACALVIQQTLGHFETEVNVELKVKLAISCGNMTFSVIGDSYTKHYVIAGEAINDVKAAEHGSVSGDVVISPGAWAHMLQERYETTPGEHENVKVWSILYKPNEAAKKIIYHEKQLEATKLTEMHINHRNALHAKKRLDSNLSDSKMTERFIRILPQRVQMKLAPRHWIVEDLRPFIIKPVQDLVDESQPVEYLTEMRDVTIQFINIVPLTYYEPNLLELVNKAYQVVCKIAGNALGVVNKVSLFDKDAMILVLFGLRAINHETESQNALRSAYQIRAAILQLKDVKSASVGVTNGYVYCGVVGHPMRREYTVIGGAVNKAARIMCAYMDKVTCDHKTFRRSKLSSYYFQLQSALKLKGIEDAGNIFEYNENFDTPSFLHLTSLPTLGRLREYDYIKSVVKNKDRNGYYGICFYGPPKIGKTRIVHMGLKSLKETKKYSVASIALDGSGLIPYFCISNLYRQLYDQKTLVVKDNVEIINLPRNLWNFHESLHNQHEDIAWQKYRILNYFRDLIHTSYNKITLLFIDNLEYIDQQSWEILDITLNDGNIRLIASATFDEKNIEFQRNISRNGYIKQIEVAPIADKYVPIIACQMLAVCGIPKLLVNLLIQTCEGRPGYIQCCLLRLVNNGSVELELVRKNDRFNNYVFPPVELLGYTGSSILPIIQLSDKYKRSNDDLTLAAISLDLFDSFTPYQQLVIKTGACLGDLFTRTLLIIALKYPTEATLAKVIEQLFQEEVFECGARFIYASELDNAYQICCRCYFEEDFISDKLLGLQKFAFCKILHFRNKSIREVAYDILPNNQKTELHLLCTDVLENINNKCPNCLRNPMNNFINTLSFKELMNHCNNPEKIYLSTLVDCDDYGDMKECIRRCMRKSRESSDNSVQFVRPVFDPKMCNCFEILARVYKDLIYHSYSAAHIGKQIFFTMKYGLLLYLMQDYMNAITMLTEARELCMNDTKIQSTSLMGTFKKVVIGKIEIALSNTFLEIRQLRAAKNHLAIALRQYNIPSVSLTYKHFSKLLTRSFLVNNRKIKPFLYKNTVIRNDMCHCLNICTKLFIMEGNWAMAKLTSAYGLHLSRMINTNVELLCETYCTAIDIARYTQDVHFCEKLQKYAVREIQQKYSDHLTYNFYSLNVLLTTILDLRYASGEICKAIRIGYRVLDISLQISLMSAVYKSTYILALLLLYNFRLSDCGDVCRILRNCLDENDLSINLLIYHCLNIFIYRRGGFLLEPIEQTLKFATKYFANKVRFSWQEYLFMSLLHVHFLLLGQYDKAEEWRHSCSFNRVNIRRKMVFVTLIMTLEGKILMYLKSLKVSGPNVKIEEKVILNLLKLADSQVRNFPIHVPIFNILSAWVYMIKNKKRRAYKLLNLTQKIVEKQENYMMYALITQLKNAWNGGYFFPYNNRPALSYKDAMTFSPMEWAQYISPYPLE